MKERDVSDGIAASDVAMAVESLNSSPFRDRLIRAHAATSAIADAAWKAPDGRPIDEYVRDQRSRLKRQVESMPLNDFRGGMFHTIEAESILTVAHHQRPKPSPPTPRDLLHVYGPDKNATNDRTSFYRFAWKDKGPHAILHSTDPQIIQQGQLACTSYSYSGQSSYALVGAGMFFEPHFGDATVNIRPYVQWLTSASFTGNDRAPASAAAHLGIYVSSWARTGGGHYVDRDVSIPVWSQNTSSYLVQQTASGSATAADGLSTDILAVSQRKYAIFVYVYLETSAGAQQTRNETRYVGLDIDAVVPYVAVQETLL